MAEDAIAADGKGGWQDVANCRLANPALAIDLQVLTLLSGDAPETFTLMVGAEQTARFKPLPMREIDSRVQWAQSNDRSTGALREGMRIVTPAHRVGKTWSLMGDVILGIDENDVVYLPRRTGDCLNTLPQELNGADIGAIQERLGQCSGKDETQIGYRISLREALWGEQQPRSFYASAYCTDSIESFEDTTGLGSESIDSPMTEDAEN